MMRFLLASLALSGVVVAAAPTGKMFDKFIFIMLENYDKASILADPNFSAVAATGLLQSNYHGVSHPSQPNYWAIVTGAANFPSQSFAANTSTPFPINGDNGDSDIDITNSPTLFDLLDAAGLDFKMYSENYPATGSCFLGTGYGDETPTEVGNYSVGTIGTNPANRHYKRKHNPLISFTQYSRNATRCATQKDFNDLNSDLASGNLPAFSYIVPNQAHDGHDTTIAFSGLWFAGFIKNVTSSPVFSTSRVLVHVAYDEDDSGYTYYYNAPFNNDGTPNPYYNATCAAIVNAGGTFPANYCAPANCKDLLNCMTDTNNNTVYSLLLGSALPSSSIGATDNTLYSHYSVTATIEANWGLPSLGRGDVTANTFSVTAPTPSTAPVTSPGFPACYICGNSSFTVTKPNNMVTFPGQQPVTCSGLSNGALNGFVDPNYCVLVQNGFKVHATCGCQIVNPGSPTSTFAPSPAPAPTAPVPCNFCGSKGFRTTLPDFVVTLPDGTQTTCGALEDQALGGKIDPISCQALTTIGIPSICGCILCRDNTTYPFIVDPLSQRKTCQWLAGHKNQLIVSTPGLTTDPSNFGANETWGNFLCTDTGKATGPFDVCVGTCHSYGCNPKCSDSTTQTFNAGGRFGQKDCKWLYANKRNWNRYCNVGSAPAASVCPYTCNTCL